MVTLRRSGRFFRVAEMCSVMMVRHILRLRQSVYFTFSWGEGGQDHVRPSQQKGGFQQKEGKVKLNHRARPFRPIPLWFQIKKKKKKFLIQTLYVTKKKCEHDCRRRRRADSNDGKLSFPAHERVLRGKLLCARLDRWSVNHREVNAHRNIHSHKCRLCPSWFLMGVCVSVCVRTVSLCIQQLKMRLHCKSLDGKNDC